MDRTTFLTRFGGVYEHSPWVAEAAFDAGADTKLTDTDALNNCFKSVFMKASAGKQLAVLRAHPQLACTQAELPSLSSSSREEQSGAGLNQCSAEEFKAFAELNSTYEQKFGFPFIVAVKGLTRQEILAVFQNRLGNDTHAEFQTALKQVCKIARLRIGDLIDV